jgi:hypothetical protein
MQDTTSKEAKVYNLCQDLEEIKTQKKAAVKGFNEEIKRLQAEIKELLESSDEG